LKVIDTKKFYGPLLVFGHWYVVALIFVICCYVSLPLSAADAVPSKTPVANQEEMAIEPFGSRLFNGNFLKARGDGLNPDYILAPGDKVAVAVWGSVTIKEIYTLDSQGNIFIPDIGPLKLVGVKNADLTETVKKHIEKIYTTHFNVYTNLETAQPVGVYVTGMVNNPGRYAGLPSDSILYFIDLAEGIDPRLGSYRQIEIIRAGETAHSIDLYDFILKGEIASPQLREGDTILVKHRGSVVYLEGDVARSTMIEMKSTTSTGGEVLKVIPKAAQATEVTIIGMRNGIPYNQTMPTMAFLGYTLHDGDQVDFRDDGQAGAILIKIVGEFNGPAVLSVKRGSRLIDILNHIPVNAELANVEAIHLRRASVAISQKDAISDSLFRLERSSLLALSGSQGEANIRVGEAEMIAKFAERARLIEPLGRVVTAQNGVQQNILMEPDDTIVIPRKTEIVRVAGEVMLMHAITYHKGWTVGDYIKSGGGFSNRADTDKIIIHHPNAAVTITDQTGLVGPGDEIIVSPKIDPKTRQFFIDMLDVIYKVAVSAAVVLTF
jgi:protein involved in polysaccharide export with SLBB domain